jgi:DNA-nicking Smr family endonuclease
LPGRPDLPEPLPEPLAAPVPETAPPPPHAPPAPAMRAAASAPPYVSAGSHPPGLDSASWHRFRDGKLRPSRTLDLHGKTVQAAYHALERFLHAAHADHVRCVEIVTGRGKGETGGVIRRELPMWLNLPALRPLVLAAVHPGGTQHRAENVGATRLLLRRRKLP